MPIPDFDTILNVLPPHMGDPRSPEIISPYSCTTTELWEQFATSNRRRDILKGYLELRKRLRSLGVTGFQWLDGSFLEDIEAQQGRDPNDLDVVTFVATPVDEDTMDAIAAENTWLANRDETKSRFAVDHFLVPLNADPRLLVDLTRYWYGLFSHRRDGTWKGMLTIDLNRSPDMEEPGGDLGKEA